MNQYDADPGAWAGSPTSRPAGRPPTSTGRAAPPHPSGAGGATGSTPGFGFTGRTRVPGPAAGGPTGSRASNPPRSRATTGGTRTGASAGGIRSGASAGGPRTGAGGTRTGVSAGGPRTGAGGTRSGASAGGSRTGVPAGGSRTGASAGGSRTGVSAGGTRTGASAGGTRSGVTAGGARSGMTGRAQAPVRGRSDAARSGGSARTMTSPGIGARSGTRSTETRGGTTTTGRAGTTTTTRSAAGRASTARTGTARTAAGRTAGTSRTAAARTASRASAGRPVSTRATTRRPARAPRSVRAGGGPPRRPPRSRLLRLGDPGRRLGVGFAAVCTLLVILGGRLVQLQGFDSDHLAAKAEQKLLSPTTIPATRGQIVDRNGNPLAYSVTARTIVADPRTVTDPPATAKALAGPLKKPVEYLLPRLTKPKSRYVVLAKDLTPTEAAEVLALKLKGISADDSAQRIYPGNDLAAAVIGYTNAEGGQGGIESKYDDKLKGTAGRLEVELGSNGLQIPGGLRKETAAVPGSTVQLTIDQDLQFQLQRGLAAAVAKAKASDGQAVIMDAHTGEVLAMATAPTFDAQNPSKYAPAVRTNLAVQAPVEPGSANKVVTFAAAVQDGKLRPDTPMLVPGAYAVPGAKPVRDAWVHGPAHWTATGVLAKSSNVGTLMIANDIVGPAQFYDTERKFGIGQKTGIELPGESAGRLLAPADWSNSSFLNLPIGQGLSMTPLQLAGMYQTIANDGVRVQPRIVKAVLNPDGTSTPSSTPERTTVITPAAARTVRGMLEAVVGKGGTAPKAAIDNYRVAGKTGTAQRSNPTCGCYVGGGYWATFAGMAPADKPALVMSVVITEPPGGGEGGSVAAPLFHDVMSYALTARKVTPTGTPVPVAKLTTD